MCTDLFADQSIQALSTKMPILPGQLPTRDMLDINEAPSLGESQAIGALESVIRNCKSVRAASGYPTSASEDILEVRVSKLRYGLYKGDIPFAVYNYGLAQALRKHTQFMAEGEQAYTQGQAIGDVQALGAALQSFSGSSAYIPTGSWACSQAGCF